MTVQAKPTYTQAYETAATSLKQRICKLLEWDEMQYAEFQYQTGIAYLYWYLPCDARARYELERSKLYWNWFKNQWNQHDFVFDFETEQLPFLVFSVEVMREQYQQLHCPRAMAVDIKPNEIVLSSIKIKA